MRNNYVLIDHENVHPASLALLSPEHFKVFVFIGANQTKIASDVAVAMHAKGASANYVRMDGSGPNALDFHVAFYMGQLAAKDPTGFFHVISKDTGFDPLIRHLRQLRIFAARSVSIEEMPCFKAAIPDDERVELVIEDLRKRASTRPATVRALTNAMSATFKNQLDQAALEALVETLKRRGVIADAAGKLTYRLPELVTG